MAANRIKGITIEIGGDTTKLQTALKGVNTEIRNTQSQLYMRNPKTRSHLRMIWIDSKKICFPVNVL